MKNTVIILILLIDLNSAIGQILLAGDTTGITYYDFEPDIHLITQEVDGEEIYELDVNYDEVEDVLFKVKRNGDYRTISYIILNESIEACRYEGEYCTHLLSESDSILCNNSGWPGWQHYNSMNTSTNEGVIVLYDYHPMGGEDCWWNQGMGGNFYVPFRYLDQVDTLLAWVEIEYQIQFSESYLKIKSYGIEGDFMTNIESIISQGIRIYPNPCHEEINFEAENRNGSDFKLSLFDNRGRLIERQETISNLSKIDVSDLTPGIYFLKIENNKEALTKKIVKL